MFFVDNNIPVLASVQNVMLLLQKTLHYNNIPLLKDVILPKGEGQDIMFTCPFHKNGNENRPSAGIQTKAKSGNKIFWHCLNCHEKGTLETLVSKCFGYEDFGAFGTKWILSNFNSAEIEDRTVFFSPIQKSNTVKAVDDEYITDIELDKYHYYCSYQKKRHLTEEVIDLYDVGYDKDFFLGEAITFPVRNVDGKCLFVARRTIYKKNYWYPVNCDKPLYGVYEVNKLFPNTNQIYICESMLNTITLAKYGIPSIALLGTGTNRQYELIKKLPYRSFVLALDGDEAGKRSMEKLRNALKNKGFISQINLPEDKDINDLGGYDKKTFQKVLDFYRVA